MGCMPDLLFWGVNFYFQLYQAKVPSKKGEALFLTLGTKFSMD
jgi:hypothetical protein